MWTFWENIKWRQWRRRQRQVHRVDGRCVKKIIILGSKMVHNLASTYVDVTCKRRKGIWPKRHHTVSLRSPVSFWQMISLHSFIPLLQRWLLIWVKGSREGGIDWETLAWWKRKDSPWGPLAGVVCLVWISSLHQGPLTISPPLSNIILQTDGCLCFPADEGESWGVPQCSGNLDLCWFLESLRMVLTITFSVLESENVLCQENNLKNCNFDLFFVFLLTSASNCRWPLEGGIGSPFSQLRPLRLVLDLCICWYR